MQKQVHQAQAACTGHDLIAKEGAAVQKLKLANVELAAPACEPLISAQKEPARATRRVGNGLHGLGPHTLHHGLYQRAGREVLARAAFGVFGIVLQQAFVQVTLGVGIQADPALGINQLHQPREFGRVLNLVLCLEENRPQHAQLLKKKIQAVDSYYVF